VSNTFGPPLQFFFPCRLAVFFFFVLRFTYPARSPFSFFCFCLSFTGGVVGCTKKHVVDQPCSFTLCPRWAPPPPFPVRPRSHQTSPFSLHHRTFAFPVFPFFPFFFLDSPVPRHCDRLTNHRCFLALLVGHLLASSPAPLLASCERPSFFFDDVPFGHTQLLFFLF